MGDMADFDLFHWGEDDEWSGEADLEVTCFYCGYFPLEWKTDARGRWRLYTLGKGALHECKRYQKAKAKDRKDLRDSISKCVKSITSGGSHA
jgi:hypothetical protein